MKALAAAVAFVGLALAPGARAQVTPGCQVGSFDAASSTFALDADGDGVWSDGDRTTTIGATLGSGNAPVVGDWNGDGFADVGVQQGSRFLLDLDGDGVWEGNLGGDRDTRFAASFGPGVPLVGRWTPGAAQRIGVFVPATGTFLLDANGNGIWDGTGGGDRLSIFGSYLIATLGQAIAPIIGDWNGDGVDDVGVAYPGPAYPALWLVDRNGDGQWSGTSSGDTSDLVRWPTVAPRFFSGDWDLDGADELGLLSRHPLIERFAVHDIVVSNLLLEEVFDATTASVPLACDWDGDGGENLGKAIGSRFSLDANGNGEWDGDAGGDRDADFLPPAGAGTAVTGRWLP